ncbi:hypothetical protein YerA41_110 [Yersinia phage YerA41]|uniref:Uncharacterized protein n=1 Tax=Yersinia phage vB_Yru_GN1 TaxID=3074381 RepID=A0AA86IYG0_9CAUD|nr:hypothetical protein YerA41_110 [Yersinia phage YerA41]BES79919.1 hypothetical protein [Yersinia phage vB_Yru_GN1]
MKQSDQINALSILAEIMDMEELSKKRIGFVEIMKVDKKTFTISSIDQDEFTSSLNDKGLVNEFTIQDRAGESE